MILAPVAAARSIRSAAWRDPPRRAPAGGAHHWGYEAMRAPARSASIGLAKEVALSILAPQRAELGRLLGGLDPLRANPTGHFWFTKIPAGRYYIVSLIEGGAGSHQEERAAGIAWLLVDLEAGAKETNLVVTDCKSNLC